MALRRAPERTFCRVMGLRSTEPLDEIAAFYGDTPWWVSDSHGLGPELEERGLHPRLRLDEVHARRRRRARRTATSTSCGSARSAPTTSPRSSPAGSGCPTGRSRSPRTSSAVPAGRATSPTTASAPAGAGALYVHEGVGWLGLRRDAAGVPRPRRPERDPRRPDRGRPPAGLPRRSPPRPASSRTAAPRTRTATSSGQVSGRQGCGQTTARRDEALAIFVAGPRGRRYRVRARTSAHDAAAAARDAAADRRRSCPSCSTRASRT